MNRGDRFRRSGVVVGNWLYHSVGDREDTIEALAADYNQAYREIGAPLGVLPPYGPENRAKAASHPVEYAWWGNVARPLFEAWDKFRREELGTDYTRFGGYIGYGNRFVLDWDTLQAWRKKLVDLRNTAQMFGLVPIGSKGPAELPTTIPEDVEHLVERGAKKAYDAGAGAIDFVKIALYGALALGGALVVSSIVSNVRAGSDPAKPYLQLAGRSR